MSATDNDYFNGVILAVNEDEKQLEEYIAVLAECFPRERITGSQMGSQALALARSKSIGLLLLPPGICGDMRGIRLAKKIRLMHPNCVVLLAASPDELDEEAENMDADGLIRHPVSRGELSEVLAKFESV